MDDFGQKRPASDDAVKGKRGRPKKKPTYDKTEAICEQLKKAVELFDEPYDDRIERSEEAPSISAVARELNTTTIRIKKMLITAGFYTTAVSRKVLELHESGASMKEIMEKTGLKEASVYSYLPYSKGVYNLDNPTLCAEQNRRFRKRKAACKELAEHLDKADAEEHLWNAIVEFENYLFQTAKGLPLRYSIKGGEIFFSRKEKSITKSTVFEAFRNAREVQEKEGFVSGPKKLKTFGASYLYPVFLRIGVCKNC